MNTRSKNLPHGKFKGLFEKTIVHDYNGIEAIWHLTFEKKTTPSFSMIYHPKCPHCIKHKQDWINLKK